MAIVTTNLRSEASAEACRAAQVRTHIRKDEAQQLALLEGSGVWLGHVRRTEARRALRGRFVLLWRVAVEDTAGRLLASILLPVAVDVAHQVRISLSPSRLGGLIAELERATHPLVELAAADWQQASDGRLWHFPSTRLARERAIASNVAIASAERRAYQPGLFDRRVDRERRSDAAFAATVEEAIAERLRAAEQLVPAAPRPPRLLLVLVP